MLGPFGFHIERVLRVLPSRNLQLTGISASARYGNNDAEDIETANTNGGVVNQLIQRHTDSNWLLLPVLDVYYAEAGELSVVLLQDP